MLSSGANDHTHWAIRSKSKGLRFLPLVRLPVTAVVENHHLVNSGQDSEIPNCLWLLYTAEDIEYNNQVGWRFGIGIARLLVGY